jgi:NADH dehydrogenase
VDAVVTGAFGYTGRHITQLLLDRGDDVRTLTNDGPDDDQFGGRVGSLPLRFDRPDDLVASLDGADVLFNTYWVRFERGAVTFDRAIRNSYVLLDAARAAGVRRIVHVSITNPFVDPSLPYFRGKAAVEDAVVASGLPFGIVRPTVVFGGNDVFINNLAWLLRTSPVFPIPGRGNYRLQPVSVFDVADLCVAAADAPGNVTIDAAGPEIFTFRELLDLIRHAVGSRAVLVPVPPAVALTCARIISPFLHDVVLTKGELRGLQRELIVSPSPPTGRVSFRTWLDENADMLGRTYASELDRNYRRETSQEPMRVG